MCISILKFMAVCCGESATVCLDHEGQVWGIGFDGFQQWGDSDDSSELAVPKMIKNLPEIVSISCGSHYSMFVDASGSVWGLGKCDFGQLGIELNQIFQNSDSKEGGEGLGSPVEKNLSSLKTPHRLQGLPEIISVHCGHDHTVCIDTERSLWSFGHGTNGELGFGDCKSRRLPEKVPKMSNIILVSCGFRFSYALDGEGNIYSCGRNDVGQCGIGRQTKSLFSPMGTDLEDVIDISCGREHVLFLKSTGSVYSMGGGHYGKLGRAQDSCSIPQQIRFLPPTRMISCGVDHSLCVDKNGNVHVFGSNSVGQIGLGDTGTVCMPTKLSIPSIGITTVSKGTSANHYFIKDSEERAWAFGDNSSGQLGLSKTIQKYKTPTQHEEDISKLICRVSDGKQQKSATK